MNGRKQISCAFCDKEKLSQDEIGLNKKLIHRQIERMMCLACLGTYFEISEEHLKEMIQRFKQEGCTLFGGRRNVRS